jgi:hypothetical protein
VVPERESQSLRTLAEKVEVVDIHAMPRECVCPVLVKPAGQSIKDGILG